MNTESTDGLIRRILDGDLDSYSEIIRRYQEEVWKVVTAMLREMKATEDLVQQVFVEAFAHLDRFQQGADFSVWIKSIARNLVRQELRSRVREGRRLEVYQEHLASRFRDDRVSAEREEAVESALRHCRELLPEHGAEVLTLRYERALPFEDIAASLGRSVEATRQLLFRVRAMLRECIEKRLARP